MALGSSSSRCFYGSTEQCFLLINPAQRRSALLLTALSYCNLHCSWYFIMPTFTSIEIHTHADSGQRETILCSGCNTLVSPTGSLGVSENWYRNCVCLVIRKIMMPTAGRCQSFLCAQTFWTTMMTWKCSCCSRFTTSKPSNAAVLIILLKAGTVLWLFEVKRGNTHPQCKTRSPFYQDLGRRSHGVWWRTGHEIAQKTIDSGHERHRDEVQPSCKQSECLMVKV